MATYLADTNILLRLSDTRSALNTVVSGALARLFRTGNQVAITPQNLVEYWAVATRPSANNGLGWLSSKVAAEIAALRERFYLLAQPTMVLEVWFKLVQEFGVRGKRTHDARLVAVMKVNEIQNLLTFNTEDFQSFNDIHVIDARFMV